MPEQRKKTELGVNNVSDAEKAAKDVRAALDSVTLINQIVESGSTAADDIAIVTRNVDHLKIVLERDHVKNSQENLAPLSEGITAGTTYLANAKAA